MTRASDGYTLVDLLVVLAIVALFGTFTLPPLARISSGLATRQAAAEVVGAMRQARAYALRHQTKVGLKFQVEENGRVSWALYRDGDGDGVRSDDIERGVDPIARAATGLHFGRGVRFGFPPGQAPSDPSDPYRRLERLDDPIRFNRSDIASFSPVEGATPGSIYLTDGARRLLCVRVQNRTGRPRVLTYDPDDRSWSE
jgi:type II secretory pathway pseudopilin PulG